MKNYTIYLIIAFACLANRSISQVRQLHIGDTLPHVVLSNVLNYAGGKIDLADVRGKILMLDFWSTWCAPCIKSFPKSDSLQRKYADHLFILPVTGQDRRMISAFWSKNEYTQSVSLPTVVEDTLLSAYFPHVGVPFVVWIDTDGTVMGFTDSQYVDERNVTKAINGKAIDWPYVGNNEGFFDFSKPMLPQHYQHDSVLTTKVQYRSITPHLDGVKTRTMFDTLRGENSKQVLLVNYPIIGLYRQAIRGIGGKGIGPDNRIVIKVSDTGRLIYDKTKHYKASWLRKNTFCYESIWAGHTDNRIMMEAMLADLNTYFDLNGRVENQPTECFVLTRIRDLPFKEQQVDISRNSMPAHFTSADLVDVLNKGSSIPTIDESGLTEDINIPLESNGDFWQEIGLLNKRLEPFNLRVVKTIRNLDRLIITDR
ncbi:TlpA family protein disulfide reductase [Parapedobacter indicus]|uniref:Thiol-disulfide isomerase or thioredoxin n=1 Tax=Parapedobacter indicus TaxID=1477437 RepID=A0A1I3UHK7_9SPHI|nr:TlpA disulfide reductase family protein [Parapedobacter indicus]PPK99310.1 thiol-disulfide isomerase/thioredoxin [Parapedobacter indicus]SFJ82412.1 Thiol-disulfide isomerase or thioredoxin [Parapedobacter indicus]